MPDDLSTESLNCHLTMYHLGTSQITQGLPCFQQSFLCVTAMAGLCFQHLCLPFRPLPYLTWPTTCGNSIGRNDSTLPRLPPARLPFQKQSPDIQPCYVYKHLAGEKCYVRTQAFPLSLGPRAVRRHRARYPAGTPRLGPCLPEPSRPRSSYVVATCYGGMTGCGIIRIITCV